MQKPRTQKVSVHRAWLRELRIEKGLTLGALADMVGKTENYIGEVERGRRNPSPALALSLSKFLEFDIQKLYIDALPRHYRGTERKAAQ